mmetsp:Transcript_59396/g.158032  ORF Transcript_59396/g.158032 Transcript_59396/m.158032 type:complete len:219 (+) Transcript_59396:136-792(+)
MEETAGRRCGLPRSQTPAPAPIRCGCWQGGQFPTKGPRLQRFPVQLALRMGCRILYNLQVTSDKCTTLGAKVGRCFHHKTLTFQQIPLSWVSFVQRGVRNNLKKNASALASCHHCRSIHDHMASDSCVRFAADFSLGLPLKTKNADTQMEMISHFQKKDGAFLLNRLSCLRNLEKSYDQALRRPRTYSPPNSSGIAYTARNQCTWSALLGTSRTPTWT